MTVLPESGGYRTCEEFLATRSTTDTAWDLFKFLVSLHYRYCSDMIWSGHTQHLIGGAILFCTLANRYVYNSAVYIGGRQKSFVWWSNQLECLMTRDSVGLKKP